MGRGLGRVRTGCLARASALARAALAPAVLVLLLLVPPVSALSSAPSVPLASTQAPVTVAGRLTETVHDGAVHLRTAGDDVRFELDAASAQMAYTCEAGLAAGPPWYEDALSQRPSPSRSSDRFTDVTVEVERQGGPLEVLAFPDGRASVGRLQAEGAVEHEAQPPTWLARVGASPEAQGTGPEPIGFWKAPDPSWLIARGGDQASLEGSFSLFVHNATVTVRQDGQVVWENWTGQRRTGDTGLTHRCEAAVLVIDLIGAHLDLAAEDRIAVLGDQLDLEAEGTVTTRSVQGQVATPAGTYRFSDEPLRLAGNGSLTLTKTGTGAMAPLALRVPPSATFDVSGGHRIAPGSPGPWAGPGVGLLATSLLLLGGVAIALTAALGPEPTVARWRDRRAWRAIEEGKAPWQVHVARLIEAGQGRAALAVLDRLAASPRSIDEGDRLAHEAQAAHLAGQASRCRHALMALALEDAALAAHLARRLGLVADR